MTYDLGGGSRTRTNNRKKLSLASLALVVFCMALASVPEVRAQSVEHSRRKVTRTQRADYPAILKSRGIGGIVRLDAHVLANGTVASVRILGGNPILAQSAVKAVMAWKYAPAAKATIEVVAFDFNPH